MCRGGSLTNDLHHESIADADGNGNADNTEDGNGADHNVNENGPDNAEDEDGNGNADNAEDEDGNADNTECGNVADYDINANFDGKDTKQILIKNGKDKVFDADADENGAVDMPQSIWCLVFLLRSWASKVRTLSEYEIDTFAVFREEEEGSLALSIRGGVHPWLSAWGGRRIIISNHLGNLGTMGRQTDRPGRFMNHHCSKTTIAIIHVITTIMHIPPYSSSSESRSQCTSETIG